MEGLPEYLAESRALLREQVARVVEGQFRDVEAEIQERWKKACEQAHASGRKSVTEEFSRTARCLRQAGNFEQWLDALMDEARRFAERVALVSLEGELLVMKAQRGFASGAKAVRLNEAPALKAAIESKDPVVAMRTEREVSQALFGLSGAGGPRKVYLTPLAGASSIRAVLYAEGAVDLSGLEMLAHLAAASLELRERQPGGLVAITTAQPQTQDELHLRAQRYARVRVAEMQLYKAASVKSGRLGRNLYGALRAEIDGYREEFQAKFFARSRGMLDYLHQELVHTLAGNDEEMLGPEYPGALE
jgi:hypothetical protein